LGHPQGRLPKKGEWVGLPPRPFTYTPDQIGVFLGLSTDAIENNYLWYEGRQPGAMPLDRIRAINIAEPSEKPVWRVAEQELIRWMKRKKFRYYERSWVE